MKKKIASMMMATFILGGVCMPATGCGKRGGIQIDHTKTQLYISNHDAGIGRSWIEAVGAAFAEDFANYSFEEGKQGVQVIYNHNSRIGQANFYETIERDADYVYFAENIDYAMYGRKFADVTDIMGKGAITGVDENNNFIRESNSIANKMDSQMLIHLDMDGSTEVQYNAFPYYLGLKNVNYNIDLWSEKEFYFSKDGAPSEIVAKALNENGDIAKAKMAYESELAKIKAGEESMYWFFANKDGKTTIDGVTYDVGLSAGPDGKYDTPDDGLPATYEEFYLLLDKMSSGVTPFIWTGHNAGYADQLTTALWQNHAGAEDLKVYYTLNGTLDNLVEIGTNGKVVKIGGELQTNSHTFAGGQTDGYEAQRMISKYYALEFAEKIAKTSTWTHTACYDSTSQSEAQNKYLTQGYTASGKPIAMLMDGSWWQQEADTTFEIMAKQNVKYKKSNRNYGMFYLPVATIDRFVEKYENGEKNTIVAANDSYSFINGNLAEGSAALAVSKAFLSYTASDKAIGIFMEHTNMLRPFQTEISDEVKQTLSPYGQNLLTYKEYSTVLYSYTDNQFIKANRTVFKNAHDGWNWHSYTATMGEKVYPITSIRNALGKGVTGETYFEGLYNYYKNVCGLW